MTTTKTAPTFRFDIFMAGDIAVATQTCREFCMAVGLCVTIEPVEYVYTGGQETGFRVGLMNYPRFPTTEVLLSATAEALADKLRLDCCQHSYSIQGKNETIWSTTRE